MELGLALGGGLSDAAVAPHTLGSLLSAYSSDRLLLAVQVGSSDSFRLLPTPSDSFWTPPDPSQRHSTVRLREAYRLDGIDASKLSLPDALEAVEAIEGGSGPLAALAGAEAGGASASLSASHHGSGSVPSGGSGGGGGGGESGTSDAGHRTTYNVSKSERHDWAWRQVTCLQNSHLIGHLTAICSRAVHRPNPAVAAGGRAAAAAAQELPSAAGLRGRGAGPQPGAPRVASPDGQRRDGRLRGELCLEPIRLRRFAT